MASLEVDRAMTQWWTRRTRTKWQRKLLLEDAPEGEAGGGPRRQWFPEDDENSTYKAAVCEGNRDLSRRDCSIPPARGADTMASVPASLWATEPVSDIVQRAVSQLRLLVVFTTSTAARSVLALSNPQSAQVCVQQRLASAETDGSEGAQRTERDLSDNGEVLHHLPPAHYGEAAG